MNLRVFVSSPGDVGEERRLTARVVERLQYELGPRVDLEPIFWEHEPLRATASFQDQIPRPSQADIVVSILWSRLGTRLPGHLTRPDGSRYASGTEFELEDAMHSFRERGTPDLLVYRKTTRPLTELDSEERVMERLGQKRALDGFLKTWFEDAEGSFTAAFHTFDTSARFEELLEEHLRRLIDARLRRQPSGEPAPVRPRWQRGSPFRGLQSFEMEHAPVFCGRTSQVGDVLNALRRQAAAGKPFLLVTGMSGCGKSSLVRAGVLPELTYPNVIEGIGFWRYASFVPGNSSGDLFDGLAQALLEDHALKELRQSGTGIHELAMLLRERPATAVPLLRSGLSQAAREAQRLERLEQEPAARLALLVDQMEEIFTIERFTAAERQRFDAALGALVRSGTVWVLCTLRSDFYHRCAELPELMSLKEGAGQYDLRSPGAAEIGQIIRQPARVAGLRFEEDPQTGERLDDVLRDAAVKDPAALPLLEFTLDELYKRRTDDGLLTFAAYRELEGVEGALAHRAEEVFAGLPAPAQAALPSVLSALVTLSTEEERAVARRRAPLAAFAASREAKTLVDAFIEHRLLVTDRTHDGTPVVSVAHEALLHRWPRARNWLADNEELLRTRARIQSAAALWRQEGEGTGFLIPEGKLLRDAETLLADSGGHLGEGEAELVRASLAAVQTGRRRQTLWRAAAAAAVLLVVVAAWAVWYLYFRDYVTYYNSFTKRFGKPVGVGEVAGSDVRHRQWVLRFTQRGRRGSVVRVEAVNGSGHRTPFHMVDRYISGAQVDPLNLGERECAWLFEYDAEGNLLREKGESCAGRTVKEFQYKGEKGNIAIAEFTKEGLAASQAESGAALVQFARSKEGLDRKVWYLDSAGQRKPGRDGSYGVSFEEFDDDTGLPRRVVNLGPDGYAALHRDGWVEQLADYDETGRIVEVTYSGRQGTRVLIQQGFARATLAYDAYGNVKEIRLFDERNLPARGIALVKETYDEKGNWVLVDFFDGEGRRTYNIGGFFAISRDYDERGRVTTETYLDESGQPTITTNGVARIALKYDDSGNIATEAFFDEKGKPTRRLGGYEELAWKYDDEGHRIEEKYLDASGALVRSAKGYARIERRYGAQGTLIEEAYFDERGQSARDGDGVMRRRFEYDAQGRMTRQSYHDGAGEPMLSRWGAASLAKSYDGAGNPIEEAYYNLYGDPVRITEGYAVQRTEFDEWRHPIQLTYLDETRQPTPVLGCFRMSQKSDLRGNVTEISCLDEEGKPSRIAGARVSKIRLHYDERSREIGRSYFDEAGNPVPGPEEVARIRWRCDRFGNRVEETYFDESGQPILHPWGHAKLAKKHDLWGQVIEEAYLDKNGRPMRIPAMYARAKFRYDARGNKIEALYLDEQGRHVRTREGYAKVTYSYAPDGKPTEERYFDEQDEPVRTGVAVRRIEYDLSGREVRRIDVDRAGSMRAVKQTEHAPQPQPQRAAAAWPREEPGDESRAAARRDRESLEERPRVAADAPHPPSSRRPADPAPSLATSAAPATPAEPSAAGDLETTISALVAGSERILESYEEFLDREERDPDGEEATLAERLEEFGEAAGELRKAFRRATGQGGGIRNKLGLNRPGSSEATGLLQQRKSELIRLGSVIDGLARTYPLGPQASAQWQEIQRNLRRL